MRERKRLENRELIAENGLDWTDDPCISLCDVAAVGADVHG